MSRFSLGDVPGVGAVTNALGSIPGVGAVTSALGSIPGVGAVTSALGSIPGFSDLPDWTQNVLDPANILHQSDPFVYTDPYSEWVTQQQQNLWGQSVDPYTGQFYETSYNPYSQFGMSMQNALMGNPTMRVNPEDWGMMDEGAYSNYFERTAREPAMQRYEEEIRPAWLENVSNLHSSYRQNMEQKGYEDLARQLDVQEAQGQWQNALNNQQLMQQADLSNQQMAQQNQMAAMGLNQIYDPRLQMLEMVGSQTPTTAVVPPQSLVQQLAPAAAGAAALIPVLSDERAKTDIRQIDNAYDKVKKLNGVFFKYKEGLVDDKDHAGVLAQEVEKVLPEAIEEIDGVKFVKYQEIIPLLIEAIKERGKEV